MANLRYFVYILTNEYNTVLYTGVTNNLERRMLEHIGKRNNSFTKRYNICKLVYFQIFNTMPEAIHREKQLKSGSRERKIKLIEQNNILWEDLYEKFS